MNSKQKFGMVNGHTLLLGALGESSIILDLGSNRGSFSRNLKRECGGRYYLVEANPALFEKLEASEWDGLIHCAVAAEEGTLRFHTALNDEGSSILPLSESSSYGCTLQSTVEVPARTVPSLLAQIGAARLDLLKVDIEGAEVAVLEKISASDLARISQMTVEFHCDPHFPFGLNARIQAVVQRLEEAGFLCLDFTSEFGWRRRDVLFLNRKALGITPGQAMWWKCSASARVAAQRLWECLRHGLGPAWRWVKSAGAGHAGTSLR